MPTDVVMPQMGESVAEGTIVRWIKKVGDQVARDEPLFEISTDKVDAEIPSPEAGILTEIRVAEGETVPVNSVVAVIGAQARQTPAAPTPAPVAAPPPAVETPAASSGPAVAPATPAPAAPSPGVAPPPAAAPEAAPSQASAPQAAAPPKPQPSPAAPTEEGPEDRVQRRSSPLVRAIAKEHQVDISRVTGTGIGGRVTKQDILDYIAGSGSLATTPPLKAPAPAAPARPAAPPAAGPAPGDVQPMSVMRKKIAEHMIMSRRTSAHVHSVFEVNFSRVNKVREARKAAFEQTGTKLTFMSFIIKAAANALRAVPIVNTSIDGENVIYHRDVNIGVAVALDWGLIVPVIKKADELDLAGISRAVVDLAGRARSKQLKPDEVSGGTFTITNPGVFGALFGMPIISQPQVAILGVGNVQKRAVVIDDAIAIRSMAYLTIGYDHRLIDGAVADQFMSHLKESLETWNEEES